MLDSELAKLIRSRLYDFLVDSDYTVEVTDKLAKEIASKVKEWKS